MKLIVGLGNPGEKYVKNRHNVGFMVVDSLAKRLKSPEFEFRSSGNSLYTWFTLKGKKIELLKPQTYMNDSGKSVYYAYKKHSLRPEDLCIVHDDLDIRLGEYKIQKAKGPKVHGGINSIEEKLGNKGFWRIRIGVDNRDETDRIPGEEYVLRNFTDDEKNILRRVTEKIIEQLITNFFRNKV